mgnify:CR=1 FL=1
MKDQSARRIIPASVIATSAFTVLALVQVFFIVGGMEIKASAIKRIAPFAYEPFLKMVGEHPSSRPDKPLEGEQKAVKPNSSSSAMATVAGFSPEELAVTIEDADTPILEPSVPVEKLAPMKESIEPAKKEPVDKDVPVG